MLSLHSSRHHNVHQVHMITPNISHDRVHQPKGGILTYPTMQQSEIYYQRARHVKLVCPRLSWRSERLFRMCLLKIIICICTVSIFARRKLSIQILCLVLKYIQCWGTLAFQQRYVNDASYCWFTVKRMLAK